MTAKLKLYLKDKLKRKGNDQDRPDLHINKNDQAATETLLNDLLGQLEKNQAEYTRMTNLMQAKFTQDSETIKMGLAKLLTSQTHRDGIPVDRLNRLQELLVHDSSSGNPAECSDLKYLRQHEKHLAEVEKEIIGILSKRFKK